MKESFTTEEISTTKVVPPVTTTTTEPMTQITNEAKQTTTEVAPTSSITVEALSLESSSTVSSPDRAEMKRISYDYFAIIIC